MLKVRQKDSPEGARCTMFDITGKLTHSTFINTIFTLITLTNLPASLECKSYVVSPALNS